MGLVLAAQVLHRDAALYRQPVDPQQPAHRGVAEMSLRVHQPVHSHPGRTGLCLLGSGNWPGITRGLEHRVPPSSAGVTLDATTVGDFPATLTKVIRPYAERD